MSAVEKIVDVAQLRIATLEPSDAVPAQGQGAAALLQAATETVVRQLAELLSGVEHEAQDIQREGRALIRDLEHRAATFQDRVRNFTVVARGMEATIAGMKTELATCEPMREVG